MPGTLDHRERRILAESGVGFGQAAPIEGAAGCGGDGGGMAAGVAEADRVHEGPLQCTSWLISMIGSRMAIT